MHFHRKTARKEGSREIPVRRCRAYVVIPAQACLKTTAVGDRR